MTIEGDPARRPTLRQRSVGLASENSRLDFARVIRYGIRLGDNLRSTLDVEAP